MFSLFLACLTKLTAQTADIDTQPPHPIRKDLSEAPPFLLHTHPDTPCQLEGKNTLQTELELGIFYFQTQNFATAKECFQQIVEGASTSDEKLIAHAYLARIAIFTDPENVQKAIERVRVQSQDSFLCSFLQGEASYQKGAYLQAATHFTKALPKQNQSNAPWYQTTLLYLGFSHLRAKKEEAAIETFGVLRNQFPGEQTRLVLADAYLSHFLRTQSEKSLTQLHTLLHPRFQDKKKQQHASLLLAQAAIEYEEKLHYLHPLTHTLLRDTPFYRRGWYELGRTEFNHANKVECERGRKKELLKRAKHAFTVCCEHAKDTDRNLYSIALLGRAKCAALIESTRSLEEAVQLLNSLEREEAQLILAELDIQRKAPPPRTKSTKERLFNLLHTTQSEETKGKALHLLAQIETDPTLQKKYREEIVAKFSKAPYAAENFFKLYTENEYLSGRPEAITHLSTLKDCFPDTPYQLFAEYILGLFHKETSYKESLAHFATAVSLLEKRKHPNPCLQATAAQSAIQYGQIALRQQEGQQEAIDLLDRVAQIDKKFAATEPFLCLKGELFFQCGERDRGIPLFQQILTLQETKGVKAGIYPAKSWFYLAKQAASLKQHHKALQFYQKAEKVGEREALPSHFQLELLIEKSLSFKEIGDLDQAMLLLSRVVNAKVVSSERVKAMYLRAEIYEKQHRYYLAKKQLEFTSTKGGKWSQLAKNKLQLDYTYD